MAYSDYGGYAYRNGERVESRSDAVISPEGIQSTPGAWPGWTLPVGRNGSSWHVVLGDGPLLLAMYKQSYLKAHSIDEGVVTELAGAPERSWSDENGEAAQRYEETIDGHKIEAVFEQTDNYYAYVRLTQPDGVVWTGFSGYGVGAGLESGDHGFSTQACVDRLAEVFDEGASA